ncbi:Crp/Fnr family transcriptional regulator [Legionella jordanis]|uniref:Crp/Fnr family transcriptional regulator n=1 Tax=Legionella jordanis TaxID=456 RepID=UPI0009EA2AC8|nr:helix-turn-helix domain-containing protein [Legionella jordanis]RMX04491.1 hypothetical protein EAW55_03395 [Legionella jordanis]HAT8713458.1 helix-turn-helix domain-containing protein [Legionella jordanis]
MTLWPSSHSYNPCQACTLVSFCQNPPSSSLNKTRIYQAGEVLVKANSALDHIKIIRQGAAKAQQFLATGKEQIIHFYLPGEPIGFDAIPNKMHPHAVCALVETTTCELSLQHLLDFTCSSATLQAKLLEVTQKFPSLSFNYYYSASIPAAQRLGSFFIHLANRIKQCNIPYPYTLPMKQQDIANFLGITAETTSRLLALFQKEQLIKMINKNISFIDVEALKFKTVA